MKESNYDILTASVLQNIETAATVTKEQYDAIAKKGARTLYVIMDGEEVIAHAVGDIQVPKIDEAVLGELRLGSSIFSVTK